MIFLPYPFANFDCQIAICGTQSALASFPKRPSQTRKSKIKNQKSKIIHLEGGE